LTSEPVYRPGLADGFLHNSKKEKRKYLMRRMILRFFVRMMYFAARRSVKTPTLKTAYQPVMPPAVLKLKEKKRIRCTLLRRISLIRIFT